MACRWLEKALKDLRVAEKIIEEADYSAYHSQQAAEKALKAVLVALGVQPPRVHEIEILLVLLRRKKVDISRVRGAEKLTDYAVEARYPDFEEEISREEAVEALELARKVVGWARERLEALGVRC